MKFKEPRGISLIVTQSYSTISKRHLHSNIRQRDTSSIPGQNNTITRIEVMPSIKQSISKLPPLANLSTSSVIRSYLITGATSSPIILKACFAIIKRMLDPKAVILSPDRNPLLKSLFKHTFYAQFCAGENKQEVQKTIRKIKDLGYKGVILEYALEVLKGEAGTAKSTPEEIEIWRKGMLQTVDMTSTGDFVGLKWSGIGKEALQLLNEGKPPTLEMENAIREVCDLAFKRRIALLPGAELEITNTGIDEWTMNLQRIYNKDKPGKPIMYTTYQAYLRSTPKRLARDLAIAKEEGFTLGVKLVRGAYLLSEPKSAVMSSKEESDNAYNKIVEAVLKRQYNDYLKPVNSDASKFPDVALLMATHNAESLKIAREIRAKQAEESIERIDCTYAQLQGMADELGCELIAASKALPSNDPKVDVPEPLKCATWGTVGECLNFLYRRASENQDAASRTDDMHKAMGIELWRRMKSSIGVK